MQTKYSRKSITPVEGTGFGFNLGISSPRPGVLQKIPPPVGDLPPFDIWLRGVAINGLIFKYAPTSVKNFILSIFRFAPVLLKLINSEEPLSLYR